MLDIHKEMEFVAKPFDHLDDLTFSVAVFFTTAGSARQAIGIQNDFVLRRWLILGAPSG